MAKVRNGRRESTNRQGSTMELAQQRIERGQKETSLHTQNSHGEVSAGFVNMHSASEDKEEEVEANRKIHRSTKREQ